MAKAAGPRPLRRGPGTLVAVVSGIGTEVVANTHFVPLEVEVEQTGIVGIGSVGLEVEFERTSNVDIDPVGKAVDRIEVAVAVAVADTEDLVPARNFVPVGTGLVDTVDFGTEEAVLADTADTGQAVGIDYTAPEPAEERRLEAYKPFRVATNPSEPRYNGRLCDALVGTWSKEVLRTGSSRNLTGWARYVYIDFFKV